MAPKPVHTTEDPAIAWAEKLWDRLEKGFLDTQNTIIAIIESKAWEPLGYESFSKAWVDRIMSKVTVASELRPHVVYQMFSEGLTAEQVADAVKGITTESANELKRQRNNGVPADQATTVVRRHHRRKPGNWSFLHIKVDTDTLKEWKRLAKEHNKDMTEVAHEAVTAAFEKLASPPRRRTRTRKVA